MKKNLVALCVVLAGLCSCNQSPTSYIVKGTLPDSTYNGKTLYLLRYDDNKYIDSTIVKGRDFVFEGMADTAQFCRIDAGGWNYTSLILENGDVVVDFGTHRPSSTTPLNVELNKFFDGMEELQATASMKYEEFKQEAQSPEELAKLQKDYYENYSQKEFQQLFKSYFIKNNDNPVGVNALLQYSYVGTPEELDELIAQAGSWALAREQVQRLIKRNEALKNTAVGKPFVDFTIEQGDGTSVSFSDYVGKGKYVLVDFWASWCGPCIQETPNIAEINKKYAGENFQVLGVAVWDRLDKTKEAIEKHNITWPQILNAERIPMDLYGIDGIPQIMLFGPDGTILARDLRGEGLNMEVAKALGE